MSTVPYEAFLPEVLPYVRDCPEFAAINAIRNACAEFCLKSTYWRRSLEPVTLVPDQAEYDLDLDLGTGIAIIMQAYWDERPIVHASDEQLVVHYGRNWRELSGDGVNFITQDSLDTIRVVPTPNENITGRIHLHVALRPLRTSVRIDKVIFERFAEVIGFGARARLHDTPGQPYEDKEAALKYRKWFQSGYGQATIEVSKASGRGPLQVRYVNP